MNVSIIIEKFYKKDSDLYNILLDHSNSVAMKALSIARKNARLNLDTKFIKEASLLHDIGIYLTNAPSIKCYGTAPYICHGYLGRELLEDLGYKRHALVCERHTGAGISIEEIEKNNLPLPHRDMQPVTNEETIICLADCFFSKTHLGKEKTIEEVRESLKKFGERSIETFDEWCERFL